MTTRANSPDPGTLKRQTVRCLCGERIYRYRLGNIWGNWLHINSPQHPHTPEPAHT